MHIQTVHKLCIAHCVMRHTHIQTHTHTHSHTHTHIYIHIHTHTYTHIYTGRHREKKLIWIIFKTHIHLQKSKYYTYCNKS